MLQASLYMETQRLFSERNCLVFLNRADEMFALSTGLNLEDHIAIQKALEAKFEDIKIQIAVGCGPTPAAAERAAYAAAERARGDQNDHILDEQHMIFGNCGICDSDDTVVMHMDIDGLSGRRISPYQTTLLMSGLHQKMSLYFYKRCESLAFFMGGDNFMIISSHMAKRAARGFVDMIKEQDRIQLNCGIGSAKTGRDAARLATESLDMIRDMRDVASDKNGSSTGVKWPRVYEHATGQRF